MNDDFEVKAEGVPFSNREIGFMFRTLHDELKEVKSIAGDALAASTKTNGSVADVMKKQASQDGWVRAISIFGSLVSTVVLAAIGYLFIQYVNLRVHEVSTQQIQASTEAGVEAYLGQYNVSFSKQ